MPTLEELIDRYTREVVNAVTETRNLVRELQKESRQLVDEFDAQVNVTALELKHPLNSGIVIITQILGNCGPGAGTLYIGRRRIPVNGAITLAGPMRWQWQERVVLFSGDTDNSDGLHGTGAAGQMYLEFMGKMVPNIPNLMQ